MNDLAKDRCNFSYYVTMGCLGRDGGDLDPLSIQAFPEVTVSY